VREPDLPFCLAVSLAIHATLTVLLLCWLDAFPPVPLQPVGLNVDFVELSLVSPLAANGKTPQNAEGKSFQLHPLKIKPTRKPLSQPEPAHATTFVKPHLRPLKKKRRDDAIKKIPAQSEPSPLAMECQHVSPEVSHPMPPVSHLDASPSRKLLPGSSQKVAAVNENAQAPKKNELENRAGAALESVGVGATPSYADNPPPVYPEFARRNGWQGEILLRVKVRADGRVDQVKIEHSSGHAMLDRSAVAAVQTWEFFPARIGMAPVPGDVQIPVRFELRSVN
jgi:periplasmic protein TonB